MVPRVSLKALRKYMENETENKFLGDLAKSEDVFETKEEAEEIPVAETEAVEDKIPFDKDPKVQKYIDKIVNKKLEELKPLAQEQFIKEVEESPLVDAFTTIIGNDTPEKVNALKALRKTLDSLEERAKKAEEAAELVTQSRQEQEAEKENLNYLQEGFNQIEDTFKVDLSSETALAKKTRNEFIDFIEKIAPKNADGEVAEYPDLVQSFQIFKEMNKPAQNTQAKHLAARSMTRSGESSTAPSKRITFENVREMIGLE